MEVDSLTRANSVSTYNTHAAERVPVKEAEAKQAETAKAEQPQAAQTAQAAQRAQQAAKQAEGEKQPESREIMNGDAAHSLLKKAIEQANKQLVGVNRAIEVRVHEKTDRLMIKVVNTDTKEVIREIPPENTLDQFAKVLEMAGLMVDEKR